MKRPNEPTQATTSPIQNITNTVPHSVTPPPTQPQTSSLIFKVDSSRSTGIIDLSLDPKGSLLGSKPASGNTPLSGTIHADVTTFPNGTQHLKITKVSLTNTRLMVMPFRWSRFVGSIGVTIRPQILKINEHSIARYGIIQDNKSFSVADNHFTVGGKAQVSGSGLVLKKAVGTRTIDLTIKKTEPVKLTGKLESIGDHTTLKISNAVMRDQFDMEGSLLKLKFTANITAQAITR